MLEPEIGLITLTGPGGVGKTQLALHVVEVQRQAFDDVLLVDLSSLHDAGYVMPSVAYATGVRTTNGSEALAAAVHAVAGRRTLLMLDNVEHVIDAAGNIADLLVRCPDMTVLATSREPLQLGDEQVYPLAPLRVPTSGTALEPDQATTYDAVRLFLECAQSVEPEFAITSDNVAAVVDICRRLDGVPLAIELAAKRVHVLPPNAMQMRLEQVLPMLSGVRRDAPQRQHTIRNAIRWSYDLLSTEEQRFLRYMVVFPGGLTVETAEFVADELSEGPMDALALLMSLVDKNLVRREGEDDTPRFTMLETIRQFGSEQLRERGEMDASRDVLAKRCAVMASDLAASCRVVVRLPVIERLEHELANVRAALAWLEETRQPGRLARLVTDLGWFWYVARHEHEGIDWLRHALEHPVDTQPDAELLARAACWEAMLAQRVHHPAQHEALERAQRLAKESHDRLLQAEVTAHWAVEALQEGDYLTARRRIAEAKSAYRSLEAPWHMAALLFNEGRVAFGLGELEKATRALTQARADALAIGDEIVSTWCLRISSLIAGEQGNPAQAAAHLQASIDSAYYAATPVRKKNAWPLILECTAVLAGHLGLWESVARLQGAANADSRAGVITQPEAATFARTEALASRHLGVARYRDEARRGAGLHSSELADETNRVFAEASGRRKADTPGGDHGGLTAREQEVLQLLAAGLSNPEIADALFITVRTAKAHVSSILMKLDVESRTAAVARAFERGMV